MFASGNFAAFIQDSPYVADLAAKPSMPLRIGTNSKVDFYESLDPPR